MRWSGSASGGDRVATLAWNTHRHYELYFGVSGIGAECHTINRPFDEQVAYIVNHAADRLLFVETSFIPLVERLQAQFPEDCRIVLLGEAETGLPVLRHATSSCSPPRAPTSNGRSSTRTLPPRSATPRAPPAGPRVCSTATARRSSTRFGASQPDAIPVSARDVVCPIVPMFHANAWSVPYVTTINGAKLVLPGHQLDGANLHHLFEEEGVTLSLGVPTVWLGFEAHLRETGAKPSTLRRILSGGAAVPPSLIEAFERRGIEVLQGWGMTEMSPLGSARRAEVASISASTPPRRWRSRPSRAARCSASR